MPIDDSQAKTAPEDKNDGASEQSQAETPDYAAIEQEISSLGDGYKLDETLPSKVKDILRGMNEAQQQLATTKKRYEPLEPIVELVQTDPGFATFLKSSLDQYESGGKISEHRETIENAIDPNALRLQQIETDLLVQKLEKDIDGIAVDHPMTAETRQAIWERVNATGSTDIEAHYWAIAGPGLLEKAKGDGASEVIRKVTSAGAQAVITSPGARSGKNAPVDVSAMSNREFNDAIDAELDTLWKD